MSSNDKLTNSNENRRVCPQSLMTITVKANATDK